MSVTLIWRTDLHLSDQTPRSRKDDWTSTVLGKIAQIGDLARTMGAHAVLDGGDFFDIKAPARNSHALVRRAMAAHQGYPCPVYANVGNHDCVYGDYSYLPQQPLGVLFEAGTFKRLYDEHELVINQGGVTVRVVGVPYHGVKYDLSRLAKITRGKEDYLVVAAHLLASPTTSTMFESEDVIQYKELDQYPAIDVAMFGHWHKDQGITKTPGGKTVVNIGSLTRGSLSQDDQDRVPSVAVLRFTKEGLDISKVPLQYAPASDVFDLETKETEELKSTMLEEFVGHLQQVLTPGNKVPLRDIVRDLPDIPSPVREKAMGYIEAAGGR